MADTPEPTVAPGLLWPVGADRQAGREKWPVLAAWLALPVSLHRACKEVRCSLDTVRRWLTEPGLLAMIRQAQDTLVDQAAKRAVLRMLEDGTVTAMPKKRSKKAEPADDTPMNFPRLP